jgi:CRISPR-associated protein Cas1
MDLYLIEFGQKLSVAGGSFEVESPDHSKIRISASEVKNIWLRPATGLSAASVALCRENGIGLWFTDKEGKAHSMLWDLKPGSISTIRQKQGFFFRHASGGQWAKNVIAGRIRMQEDLLSFLLRARPGKKEKVQPAIAQLKANMGRVLELEDVPGTAMLEKLRGLEGISAKAYFASLGHLVPEPFSFTCRSRRPAADPFNACLNYCLGILYPLVFREMLQAGLDPYLGIIHTAEYNRATGSYDFMENYRAWAEAASMSMVIRKWISPSEFKTEGQECMAEAPAREKIASFFLAFLDEVKLKGGRKLSRKEHIKADCQDFARYLLEEFEIPETLQW